jgi:LysM repeat protein
MFRFSIAALVLAAVIMIVVPAQTTHAQGGNQITHVVAPGENLFRISLRYGVSVQAIAQQNGIQNPNLIYVGQRLVISGGTGTPPGGTTPPPGGSTGTEQKYTVVAGDTLSKIARQFNVTVQSIAQRNNIANVNLIYVGQVLTIPGTTGGTTPPPGGGTTTPPPAGAGAFELGGHVANFGNTAAMQQAGMKWAKVQIRYKRGDNADITAPAINDAHLAGFKILLGIVGDKNEMAGMDYNTYTDEFAQFLGNVARLGPEAIEVWNEQNLDREWPSGRIDANAYTTMLRKAYQAIKAVNDKVLVISGAPAPTGFFGGCAAAGCDDAPYISAMAAAGAAQYMDCLGVHYNEGIISPTQSSGDPRGTHYTRYFSGMLNTYSAAFPGKQICWTELGYMSPEEFNQQAPAGFEWGNENTVAEQAQWLGEAVTASRASGKVRLLIVWNVNFTSASPDPSGMYAIVRPGGGCPACSNLANAVK